MSLLASLVGPVAGLLDKVGFSQAGDQPLRGYA
jgi:hypothetical protein